MMFNLPIFRFGSRPLIGLDISSSSIKMVELVERGRGCYQVECYATEPLPSDAVVDGKIASIERVSDSIRRAYNRMGSHTKYVAMALPSAAVISKKIVLPAGLRELDMEVQVESEANQYIPFALEEVNLDFQIIGPAPSGPDDVEVLLAASRKEMVEDRVACAEAAFLKPIVMDVESYAAQAAFELIKSQLPEGGVDQVIALVDVGASVMNFTMLRNDQTVYSREQAFGGGLLTQDIMRAYGMGQEEAETAKRSGRLPENYEPEILAPFVENLSQEVVRALQFFFTSTPYSQIDHIVLAGGCAVIPGLSDVVQARTQVPTHIANPFAGMAISSKIRPKYLQADAPSLIVACGLALRRFDQ